jgi:hypothetical protein
VSNQKHRQQRRGSSSAAVADFVDLWGEGDNSFQEDPPNAVLAFLESGDDEPDDPVIVIREPRLQDGQLSYSVETLKGNLPTHAAAAGAARNRRAGRKRKRRRHSGRVIAIRNERSPSWVS